MKRLAFLLTLLILAPLRVHAATDMQALSLSVINEFLIPSYDRLAEEADKQASLWHETCDPARLQPAFQKTMDAWAGVQHINFGPITMFLRRDRLYHWPERRNAVSKGLNALIADQDEDKLAPEQFRSLSVAVQGFPALERILYGDGLSSPYTCTLGRTIADNIAEMSRGTATDWREAVTYIEKGEAHPIFFDSNEEVADRLFTELLTGFQIVYDQKVALAMANSIDRANGKRAEFWRSGRSTRGVQVSMKALLDMAETFMAFLPQEGRSELETQFSALHGALDNLPPSIRTAVKDEVEREKLVAFLAVARETRDMIVDRFTHQLGLTIGFNSLDGD